MLTSRDTGTSGGPLRTSTDSQPYVDTGTGTVDIRFFYYQKAALIERTMVKIAYTVLTLQILFGFWFLTEARTPGQLLVAGFAVVSGLIWVAALTEDV